jgi:Leucine-rich repeat (LRR) protein
MEETDPPVEDLGQELQNYEHLQHLNLSKNGIRDIASMAYLLHLLTVNVSTNAIGSIKFLEEIGSTERLQFLQVSDLNTVTVL